MLSLRVRWPSWVLLRKIGIILLITLGGAILYLWHLGALTPGISSSEVSARHSTATIHAIIINPINAPQRILQYGLQAAGHHGAFWLRLPSVALAILFIGLFYLLVKAWFGRIVGILSTAMLATTPWIILNARSETANIMWLSPVAVLASYHWLMRAGPKKHEARWVMLIVVASLSLYTPGLIWLVLAGILIARSKLLAATKNLRRPLLLATPAIILILLTPLILAIAKDLGVGKALLLWPSHWLSAVVTIKSICWSALALVLRSPYHTDTIINRLPILDVVQVVLAVFGGYALWTKARKQLYPVISLVVIAILGAGINHNLGLLTLTIPAIAILVAGGLRYLYVEWRSVFPLNPIPKTLAIVVMVLLVSLHVLFGVRYALIAWPHTVATRQSYMLK